MKPCPDCRLDIPETDKEREQMIADGLDGVWCDCPILKVRPYLYGEEDDPSGRG